MGVTDNQFLRQALWNYMVEGGLRVILTCVGLTGSVIGTYSTSKSYLFSASKYLLFLDLGSSFQTPT